MIRFLLILAVLVVLGLILLSGRGAWLIAGYNTMPPEEKARYDQKALCRTMGKLLLTMAACVALATVGYGLDRSWLVWCGFGLLTVVMIGGAVYVNITDSVKK